MRFRITELRLIKDTQAVMSVFDANGKISMAAGAKVFEVAIRKMQQLLLTRWRLSNAMLLKAR